MIYQHDDQKGDGTVQTAAGIFGKFVVSLVGTDGVRKYRNRHWMFVSVDSVLRPLHQRFNQ